MSVPLIVNPLAEADLIVAWDYCERRGAGLGDDFVACVDEVFERLRDDPERYGCEFEDIRVAPLRRHRYAVAYRSDETQVTVVAVYHMGSDPRVWQGRV